MAKETLLVCILCRFSQSKRERGGLSGGQFLFNQLQENLASWQESEPINLQPVRCMGACDRSCLVGFMAANKLTFIFSQISPTDSVPDLLEFSRQYLACLDGKVPFKERPVIIQQKIHAVLPPLPTSP
jgi:predicted metal-binding protein